MAIALLVFALPARADYTLTVEVQNLEPGTGQVSINVFGEEDDWMRQPLYSATEPVSEEAFVVFEFDDLDAGSYGVSVLYDVNANGRLDTGFLRIPKEPFGFSNNARGRFGPPGWNKVSFQIDGDTRIEIRVVAVRGDRGAED